MSANFSLVDGKWNQFIFKKIEPADYADVLDHVAKHFLRDEPTCELLGWSPQFEKEMLAVVTLMLQDQLSFLARDESSGEIAGVRVTFNSKTVQLDALEIFEVQTEAFLNGIDLTNEQKDKIMAQYGVDCYAEFFIASTHPRYRNQGLAMEMYLRSLKFLKAEGFKLIKCVFTSPTSRRAASKLGFEEVSRVDYKDLVKKNGQLLFDKKDLTSDHVAVAMIKPI